MVLSPNILSFSRRRKPRTGTNNLYPVEKMELVKICIRIIYNRIREPKSNFDSKAGRG